MKEVEVAVTFDFDLLPALESAGIFARLDTDLETCFDRIGVLEETRDRASGALMQFHTASGKRQSWENKNCIRCEGRSQSSRSCWLVQGLNRQLQQKRRLSGIPRCSI